jgi:undecaprenyl-diphosphatase
MSVLEAIILGIIQGLSEFIPISSTAHLTLAGQIMGLIDPTHPERWTAFIAVLQLGTLAAVLIYFYNEITGISGSFLKENFSKDRLRYQSQSLHSRMGWMIIVGTIPIVVIGLIMKKVIEGEITKEPLIIASSLIGLAIVLYIAEKMASLKRNESQITMKDSVVIGLAQCLALIPGASRSGTTLTAGIFLGLTRDAAAKFSFLLSIPAVLASGLLEFYQSLGYITGSDILSLTAGLIAAAISGYYSIAFLLKFLKTRSTILFIVYRIILGLIIILANL